jgi:hypothetical protein
MIVTLAPGASSITVTYFQKKNKSWFCHVKDALTQAFNSNKSNASEYKQISR